MWLLSFQVFSLGLRDFCLEVPTIINIHKRLYQTYEVHMYLIVIIIIKGCKKNIIISSKATTFFYLFNDKVFNIVTNLREKGIPSVEHILTKCLTHEEFEDKANLSEHIPISLSNSLD